LYQYEDPFFRDIVVMLSLNEKIPSARAAELLNWKKSALENWCKKISETSEQAHPPPFLPPIDTLDFIPGSLF